MQQSRSFKNIVSEPARRAFDIFVSLAGLIALSPLFLLLAVIIKIDSPGPVFYRATRVGLNGKEFRLYKFRSMVADAGKLGPGITASGDTRVTSVGRLLRKTKIDELPQLINVLKGEMCLVGPRPEDPRYVMLYSPDQKRILRVCPGLTSPASLTFRNEEQMLAGADWEARYIHDVMPSKIEIDIQYFDNRTFIGDLLLVVKTVVAMFR